VSHRRRWLAGGGDSEASLEPAVREPQPTPPALNALPSARPILVGRRSVTEHAAFMNTLADQRFVLFGGPLAGTEKGHVRVLLIVDADSEAAIHPRLADDPGLQVYSAP
jgi:uncharacterized protein YciI